MLKSLLDLVGGLKTDLILGAIAVAMAVVAYFAWKNSVEQKAVAAWNAKQIEQVQRDQQRFAEQQKAMLDAASELRQKMADQQAQLDAKLGDISKYLSSDEAKKSDRQSSVILKETVRRLGGQK